MAGVNWVGRKGRIHGHRRSRSAGNWLVRPGQVESVIALLNEGATVPFIARYRKEQTGNLDETQIRDITHRHEYFAELEERRETVLDSIRSQGKLTPELESAILATLSKTELEDLYLPFKPKRVTRASKARDAGLEPLARRLQNLEESRVDLTGEAAGFINPEKGIRHGGKRPPGGLRHPGRGDGRRR